MQKMIVLLLVASLVACKSKSDNQSIDIAKNEISQTNLCDSLHRKGKEGLLCKSWEEHNKKKVVTISKTRTGNTKTELFIEFYENETAFLNIYDFIEDCPVDFSIDLVKDSFSITDLDNNGSKEITFLYEKACQGGIGPIEMKLMMIENQSKYKIRGLRKDEISRRNKTNNDSYDSSIIDASFKKAPKSFLEFAKKIWLEKGGTKLRSFSVEKKITIKKADLFDDNIRITLDTQKVLTYNDPIFFDDSSKVYLEKNDRIKTISSDTYGNYITSYFIFDNGENTLILTKIIGNFINKQKTENNLRVCTLKGLNINIQKLNVDGLLNKLEEDSNCIFKTI